jgi:IS30 family transposase
MFQRAHGQRNVVALVERQTRCAVLRVQPSRHSKPIMASLTEELTSVPPLGRRTVTFDRGTEFAAYPDLKTNLGIDTYFCAPQAPWQKGTVENTNGPGASCRSMPSRGRFKMQLLGCSFCRTVYKGQSLSCALCV